LGTGSSVGTVIALSIAGLMTQWFWLPVAIIIIAGTYIISQGNVDKAKIKASPPGVRKLVDSTPIEDYATLIGYLITISGALVTYFVQDPAKATSINQVLTAYVQPAAILILGFIFSVVQNSVIKAKVTVTPATTTTTPVVNTPVSLTPNIPIVTAPVVTPTNTNTGGVSLVKDRISAAVKLVSTDTGMWDYFEQSLGDKINTAMKHMLSLNPNMATIDAVRAVVDQYLGIKLSTEQCSTIQGILGLPQVLFAYSDASIFASFKTAAMAGTLPSWYIEVLRKSAVRNVTLSLVNEAINRVQNDNADIASRKLALQEFGISPSDAERTIFSSGSTVIWYLGGYRAFNGYALAGIDLGF